MMRMVAHDLNNYLGAVLGCIELVAQTCELPDKQRQRVDKALASTQEACRLLTNVMDIEKLDRSAFTANKEPTQLFALVQDVARNTDQMLQERRQQLMLNGPEDLSCAIDTNLTRRILMNLLHNAARYGPEGSAIAVEWSAEGNQAVLAISNEGRAILELDQEHIFDRFYQIKTAPEHARGGTGLGLAFAKLATEAQDGSIRVISPLPDREYGARFEVRFPLSAAETVPAQESTVTAP